MVLVGISQSSHSAHDAKNIVVSAVNTYLSSFFTSHCFVGKNQLKRGVINAREIARARWLMFFRAKSKRININASIGCAAMMLVRLDDGEVRSFALREPILTVKLELGRDNWVFTPAMHVKCCFSHDKRAGVRNTRAC